jgi:hypothetical protein
MNKANRLFVALTTIAILGPVGSTRLGSRSPRQDSPYCTNENGDFAPWAHFRINPILKGTF